ncbi:MAG: dUTP diphosphatase [Burkholderiales bacterium]|nr:dUTP diphosphatase [Burkholderiales bacterium]
MKIKVKRTHPNARMPFYATEGAACFDLYAATVSEDRGESLYPGVQISVGTGLAFEIPPGYMMRIAPRSGLAFKHGVEAFPGVIDSDFRGEVMVLLRCWQIGDSDRSVLINPGDRIAQAFICEGPRLEFEEADELAKTARGAGGFGSTGV